MSLTHRFGALVLALAGLLAAPGLVQAQAAAPATVDRAAIARQAVKSLVLVEFTFSNENNSSDEAGQGIVVSPDGVVLVSGSLFPDTMPKEWTKDIKLRLPGKDDTTVPATFLGRTKDRLFAYLKADEPIGAPPLDVANTGPVAMGEPVFAVALLGKSGGYEPYMGFSSVKTVLHLVHDIAIGESFSLVRATSPVFDSDTGKLVGITSPPLGDHMMMRLQNMAAMVDLRDEDQTSAFLPMSDIAAHFRDVPEKKFEAQRPWIGIDGLTGLEEDFRQAKGLGNQTGVTIGSVIPGKAGAQAGLQPRDIVLTVNGQPFSTSPVPDYMVSNFERVMEKFSPGEKITFGILRGDKKIDSPITLMAMPKTGAEMPHKFHEKVGFTTRDLVFTDTYARKLPENQKGVMVAMVKQGAPASLGQAPLHAQDIITRVNDQPVDSEKQFEDALGKAVGDKEAKEVVFAVIRPDGQTAVARVDLTK